MHARIRLLSLGWLAAMVATMSVATPASAQRVYRIPVNIESTPAGATVYVDSTDTPALGTTPMRNAYIPRGRHTLIFRLDGHEDGQLQVDIRRRRETFRIVLNPVSVIDITSGNADATGAGVRIDGELVGTVPHRQVVTPGRHQVQVGRDGFVTFSQWVDLAGGQVLTLPVLLQRRAPETGSLLVAGDVSGATIRIDGVERGTTPAVIEGLTAGEHLVEVAAEGAEYEPFSQRVRIVVGERLTLTPTLRRAPPETGSIRVLANVPGAIISVDGVTVGAAPVTAENITPGDHIVEASADGYEPAQMPVSVEAGRASVVSIRMVEIARAPGRIIVNANVDGATVFVDNVESGTAPIVIQEAPTGAHAIRVVAEGYETYSTTCSVAPGVDCEVAATLSPVGTPVRVISETPGAQLYVDGELMGPIPYEGTLPIGSHRIEIRADGFRTWQAVVALAVSSEPRVFDQNLVREGELTPEELAAREAERDRERRMGERERQVNIREAVSHMAAVLPQDLAVMDIGGGFPFWANLRLGIGLHEYIEAGVDFRTFGLLNELGLRVKGGYRPIRQFSVAGQFRIAPGFGPARAASDFEIAQDPDAGEHSTNALTMSFEAMMSLHFSRAGAFTLWAAMDIHSDRWDWYGNDSSCPRTREGYTCAPTMMGSGMTSMLVSEGGVVTLSDDSFNVGRQNIARGRFGGAMDFNLSRRLNVWGIFEGVIGNQRRILGDMLRLGRRNGNHMDRSEEFAFAGSIGVTIKFGTIWDDDELGLDEPEADAAE